MPTSTPAFTSTFDLTFDQTFQNLAPPVGPVAADPCRMRGAYLYWLNRFGWCGYLFGGNVDTDKEVNVIGPYQQGGLNRSSQRVSNRVKLVRAGGLTEADSEIVSSVVESVSVYALAPDKSGLIIAVPVWVEPGTVPIWRGQFEPNRYRGQDHLSVHSLTTRLMPPATATDSLHRAMLSQVQRYNALPRWRRGGQYGRWLYADIRELNETLLSYYADEQLNANPYKAGIP